MNGNQTSGGGRQAGGVRDATGRSAEDLAQQTSAATQRAYDQAKSTVNEVAGAAELGQAYYDEGARALTRQVEQQPITTIALAAAVGFILARVL